jgi:hypothetical protein
MGYALIMAASEVRPQVFQARRVRPCSELLRALPANHLAAYRRRKVLSPPAATHSTRNTRYSTCVTDFRIKIVLASPAD